jgi:membrane-associated protease RseP (regulator of RpoE activity)
MSDQVSSSSGGVAITGVVSFSPAAQAEIQPGDRVMAINGQPVSDYRDMMRIVEASNPGSKMSLDIVRGDWRATKVAYLGRHQQVFRGQPVFRTSTMVPASRPTHSVPRQPPPSIPYDQDRFFRPDYWHDPLQRSLYNSDG